MTEQWAYFTVGFVLGAVGAAALSNNRDAAMFAATGAIIIPLLLMIKTTIQHRTRK